MIPSGYPNAPAPSTFFETPTPDQYSQNPTYFDGYKAEQPRVTNDVPSASFIVDWATYHAVVINSLPPRNPWDAAAAGRAQCVFDVANWEWFYNPLSGHNKVYTAS